MRISLLVVSQEEAYAYCLANLGYLVPQTECITMFCVEGAGEGGIDKIMHEICKYIDAKLTGYHNELELQYTID